MILFQATGKSNAMPSWLEGWKPRSGVELDRHDRRDGTLWSIKADWEKVPTDIDDLEWETIEGENFRVAVPGNWQPQWLYRDRDLNTETVLDLEDREWRALVALFPHPNIKPRLRIPRCGSTWANKPNTWQEKVINIADWIREAVHLSCEDVDSETMNLDDETHINPELNFISLDEVMTLDGASESLSVTYHLNKSVIQALGFMDLHLAGAVLRELAGLNEDISERVALGMGV